MFIKCLESGITLLTNNLKGVSKCEIVNFASIAMNMKKISCRPLI